MSPRVGPQAMNTLTNLVREGRMGGQNRLGFEQGRLLLVVEGDVGRHQLVLGDVDKEFGLLEELDVDSGLPGLGNNLRGCGRSKRM